MKNLIPAVIVLALLHPPVAFSATNIHLKVAEWDQDNDGVNDSYVEVVKRGNQILSSYSRLPGKTEVGFWFDGQYGYSMADTNQDGRFDEFLFFSNVIPQQVYTRTNDDRLEPIDPAELRRAQGFWGAMAEEFPRMKDAAMSTNVESEVQFWGAFSNIVKKAEEVREERNQTGYVPKAHHNAQAMQDLRTGIRLNMDRLTHLNDMQKRMMELVVEIDLAWLEEQSDDAVREKELRQMHEYLTNEVARAQGQVNALGSASRGGPMPWSDFMKGKGPEYERYLQMLEEQGDEFGWSTPSDFEFEVLEHVPKAFFAYLQDHHEAAVEGILAGVLGRADQPEKLRAYIKKLQQVYSTDADMWDAEFSRWSSSDVDVFFFKGKSNGVNGARTEIGLLVVKDGQIIEKDVWADSQHRNETGEHLKKK